MDSAGVMLNISGWKVQRSGNQYPKGTLIVFLVPDAEYQSMRSHLWSGVTEQSSG